MEQNEFYRHYANLSMKERFRPLFLYRRKGISWNDIYLEMLLNKKRGEILLKAAQKRGLLKNLTKEIKK